MDVKIWSAIICFKGAKIVLQNFTKYHRISTEANSTRSHKSGLPNVRRHAVFAQ